MPRKAFTFNGTTKSYLYIARGWSLPAWSPKERNLMHLSGRPGAILTNSETKERRFNVPIILNSQTFEEKERYVEELSEWLVHDVPFPLIFDKYPNRTLYAVVDGTPDFEQFFEQGEGVLSFICPDPYKYGPIQTEQLTDATTIHNAGTAPTYPRYTFNVTEPITHLDIVTDNAYMRLGRPVTVEETPFERETLIFNDDCSNLIGWAPSASVEDGMVSGTLKADAYFFYSDDYGNGTGWHGPAMKHSLSEAVVDFKLEVFLQQYAHEARRVGRAEVSVLDANNKTVAKVTMKKVTSGVLVNIGVVRAGSAQDGVDIINWTGEFNYTWNNFDGVLRILRVGRYWEAYIAKVDGNTWTHSSGNFDRWTDDAGISLAPITQVQVHLAVFGPNSPTTQKINNIRITRYNDNIADQVPYFAYPGDIIEIDFKIRKIFLNGEERMDLKGDLGNSYFPLHPGYNQLMLEPAGKFDAVMSWPELFL